MSASSGLVALYRHTALLSASTSGLQLESILSSLSLSQSIHICSFSSRARSRSRPANNRGDDSLEAAPDALSFDSSLERLKGKYGHLNNARSQSREVYGTAGRSGSGMESMLRGARTGPSSLEMSAYLSMLISQLNELQDAEALLAMHAASMRPAHFVELQARLPQLDASGGNAGMRMRAMTRFLTNRIIPTAHTLPPSALVQTLSAYAQLQYAPPEAVPHLVHLLLQPAAEGASANGVGTVQVYPIDSSSQAHLLATHGSQSQSQPQQTQGSHGSHERMTHGSHERMTHGSRDVLAACNGGELAELAWALAKLQGMYGDMHLAVRMPLNPHGSQPALPPGSRVIGRGGGSALAPASRALPQLSASQSAAEAAPGGLGAGAMQGADTQGAGASSGMQAGRMEEGQPIAEQDSGNQKTEQLQYGIERAADGDTQQHTMVPLPSFPEAAKTTSDVPDVYHRAGMLEGGCLWVVPRPVVNDIWRRLAAHAAGRVMGMHDDELAKLAWAYASVRRKEGRLLHSIAAAAESIQAQAAAPWGHHTAAKGGGISACAAANLAWAYATLGQYEPGLMEALAQATVRRRRAFTDSQLSTLAWSFASLGYYNTEACGAIASAACKRIRYLPATDLTVVLTSLASLRYADEDLLQQLHRSCLRDADLAVHAEDAEVDLHGPGLGLTPMQGADMLYALASLGAIPSMQPAKDAAASTVASSATATPPGLFFNVAVLDPLIAALKPGIDAAKAYDTATAAALTEQSLGALSQKGHLKSGFAGVSLIPIGELAKLAWALALLQVEDEELWQLLSERLSSALSSTNLQVQQGGVAANNRGRGHTLSKEHLVLLAQADALVAARGAQHVFRAALTHAAGQARSGPARAARRERTAAAAAAAAAAQGALLHASGRNGQGQPAPAGQLHAAAMSAGQELMSDALDSESDSESEQGTDGDDDDQLFEQLATYGGQGWSDDSDGEEEDEEKQEHQHRRHSSPARRSSSVYARQYGSTGVRESARGSRLGQPLFGAAKGRAGHTPGHSQQGHAAITTQHRGLSSRNNVRNDTASSGSYSSDSNSADNRGSYQNEYASRSSTKSNRCDAGAGQGPGSFARALKAVKRLHEVQQTEDKQATTDTEDEWAPVDWDAFRLSLGTASQTAHASTANSMTVSSTLTQTSQSDGRLLNSGDLGVHLRAVEDARSGRTLHELALPSEGAAESTTPLHSSLAQGADAAATSTTASADGTASQAGNPLCRSGSSSSRVTSGSVDLSPTDTSTVPELDDGLPSSLRCLPGVQALVLELQGSAQAWAAVQGKFGFLDSRLKQLCNAAVAQAANDVSSAEAAQAADDAYAAAGGSMDVEDPAVVVGVPRSETGPHAAVASRGNIDADGHSGASRRAGARRVWRHEARMVLEDVLGGPQWVVEGHAGAASCTGLQATAASSPSSSSSSSSSVTAACVAHHAADISCITHDGSRVALLRLTADDLARNAPHRPLGSVHARAALLRAAGWHVALLHPAAWATAQSSEAEQLAFLANLITTATAQSVGVDGGMPFGGGPTERKDDVALRVAADARALRRGKLAHRARGAARHGKGHSRQQ